MTESVKRSIVDRDNKSYAKAFKNLSIEMNGDVFEFLKVHQNPKTMVQLEMVYLFGEIKSPNKPETNKTIFEHAMANAE